MIAGVARIGVLLMMSVQGAAGLAATPDERGAPPRSRYSLTIALSPGVRDLALPNVRGPRGAPVVVIDPGHGGHDPGASGPGGMREKDVTLAIATAIGNRLLASGRVRVALTRDQDRFLALEERSGIARALRARLFISIHADSADVSGAQGGTIYTLSETASDAVAARVAGRENRADLVRDVDLSGDNGEVSSILLDLGRRGTLASSTRFADRLYRSAATLLPFRHDHVRSAAFVVLKSLDTPGVLFEVGYLSNAQDAARLSSQAGRAAIATAVTRAVTLELSAGPGVAARSLRP